MVGSTGIQFRFLFLSISWSRCLLVRCCSALSIETRSTKSTVELCNNRVVICKATHFDIYICRGLRRAAWKVRRRRTQFMCFYLFLFFFFVWKPLAHVNAMCILRSIRPNMAFWCDYGKTESNAFDTPLTTLWYIAMNGIRFGIVKYVELISVLEIDVIEVTRFLRR